jgi:glycerophosphoryl diester phosphodiesterase
VRQASRTAALGVLWYLPELEPAWKVVDELGAVSLHPWAGICGPALFGEARRRGVDTFVWTVNDVEVIRRLVTEGASGVMTDHPELFAEILPEILPEVATQPS